MIEIMAVLVIMSIMAMAGADSIASFEANQRAERAADETLGAFRFARNLALTTGKSAKVQLSTASKTFSVYWMSNGSTWDATPVSTGMNAGGTWVINLGTARELTGTTFTVSPTSATSFTYSALGSCATTGTITFTSGNKNKLLVVNAVGDPQVQ